MPSCPSQKKCLSVHIPKTGGVSIRNILKDHFGPGFVLYYWQITDAWGQVLEKIPPDVTCVHGHYQADLLTGQFPDACLITWVRDPVERVVSSYYHRLRDPDPRHPVCHALHSQRLSLVEYAALPLVRNEMTHFFGSKIVKDFHFVGIVEDFEHSFTRMAELLEITTAFPRRDNVNPEKKTARYELDPAIREKIMELNAADVQLYKDSLDLWGRKESAVRMCFP